MCKERLNNCLLRGLAEGTWPYKVGQINTHPPGNWSRLERNKIDLQIVHGSLILCTLSSDYLTKGGLQGFGGLKTRQVIRTAKYTHGLVLLAEEEWVILGMPAGLTEIGRWYRMELSVEKARVMRISRPVPVAARSKVWICGRSPAGIVGSNPTGGMDVCLLWVLCVVR